METTLLTEKDIKVFSSSEDAQEYYEKNFHAPVEENRFRKSAKKHIENREESFERCDTDGFLSQFCSGLFSAADQLKAEIEDHKGYAIFKVLLNAETGEIASSKYYIFQNKFAHWTTVSSWMVPSVNQGEKPKWVNRGLQEKTLLKKGFVEGFGIFPAYVDCTLGGFDKSKPSYGTGGMCNVRYFEIIDRKKYIGK